MQKHPAFASGWLSQRMLALAFALIVFCAATQLLLGKKPHAARMAHRLPVVTLKRLFAVLMYGLATNMMVSYW